MPQRKSLRMPSDGDEWQALVADGKQEGKDFYSYRVSHIGVESFEPRNWKKGEALFNSFPSDIRDVLNDDLWYGDTLKHVLEGEVKGGFAKGTHADVFADILKIEVVRLLNTYPNGVRSARVKKNGTYKRTRKHHLYPDGWDWSKILEHFRECLPKAKYKRGFVFEASHKMPGDIHPVTIEIVFSHKDRSFRIVTFYPIP